MSLRLEITDLWYPDGDGGWDTPAPVTAVFTDYDDAQITIPLNGQRTAQVRVSIHDPIAAYAQPFWWALRAWFDDNLVFWGIVVAPEIDTENETVTFHAVCPSLRAVHHFIRYGDRVLSPDDDADTPNEWNNPQPSVDEGYVPINGAGYRMVLEAAQLDDDQADNYPPLGIDLDGYDDSDDLAAGTALKGVFCRGDQCWHSLLELAEHQTAPDFDITPIAGDDGFYARLNVYELQGTYDAELDREFENGKVVFHAGFGKNNATIVYRPGEKIVTHAHVLSDDAKLRITKHSAARAGNYGVYVHWEQTEYKATATDLLKQRGSQILDVYSRPPKFFQIAPKVDCEYRYLTDFMVGTRIQAAIRLGEIKETLGDARIMEVRLKQADQAGAVAQELDVIPYVLASYGDEDA